jgi:hypothetical protein
MLEVAAVRVARENIPDPFDIPVLPPRGGEGQSLPVRRPRGREVVPLLGRDLSRPPVRHVHDEEVPETVADVAAAIEEGPQAAGDAGRVRLPPLRRDAGGEGDARPVRRPDRRPRAVVQVRERGRLPARERQKHDLRRAAAARAREGDPSPVRRPARVAVPHLPARQLARRRIRARADEPERRVRLVFVGIERRHGVDDLRSVRRNLRIANRAETENVIGIERAWRGHRDLQYRSGER